MPASPHLTPRRPLPAFAFALLLIAPILLRADPAPAAEPALPPETAVRGDILGTDIDSSDFVADRLAPTTTCEAMKTAAFSARDSILALARRGSAEGASILAALSLSARSQVLYDRDQVDKAIHKAAQLNKRLALAIDTAATSPEAKWPQARKLLAARYDDYADEVEDALDAAISNGVVFRAPATSAPKL